jgi:hypothetical protein
METEEAAMDAMIEIRELSIDIEGTDGGWLFRAWLHSLGAMTVALVEDISDGGGGAPMVPRAHEIARYLCHHFHVQPEHLVLLWQDDLCWPVWIARLLGYHTRRTYWAATRVSKAENEQSAWQWKPCDWREASSLMAKRLDEPGVWITNQSCEMSRWRWEVETLLWRFRRRSRRSTACRSECPTVYL